MCSYSKNCYWSKVFIFINILIEKYNKKFTRLENISIKPVISKEVVVFAFITIAKTVLWLSKMVIFYDLGQNFCKNFKDF